MLQVELVLALVPYEGFQLAGSQAAIPPVLARESHAARCGRAHPPRLRVALAECRAQDLVPVERPSSTARSSAEPSSEPVKRNAAAML